VQGKDDEEDVTGKEISFHCRWFLLAELKHKGGRYEETYFIELVSPDFNDFTFRM
jgi:hypothetical protein